MSSNSGKKNTFRFIVFPFLINNYMIFYEKKWLRKNKKKLYRQVPIQLFYDI